MYFHNVAQNSWQAKQVHSCLSSSSKDPKALFYDCEISFIFQDALRTNIIGLKIVLSIFFETSDSVCFIY